MAWHWDAYNNDEWMLMLEDGDFYDCMGYVKKIKSMIPYKAVIEHSSGKTRYFDYLTDAKRYIEDFWGIKITKKRTGKSKWVRLV